MGVMQNFDTPTHYFNGFPILVGVPSSWPPPTPHNLIEDSHETYNYWSPHSLYPQGLERDI